ncbi:putative gustatory receptor 28b [Chironomus tepperi]|uniref:putative gustatory receptor 28b n=1 Tax=Chironomus tepperi TaxID=113505 RepID=UPI00391F7DF6
MKMSVEPRRAFENPYTIWDIVKRFHVGWKIFGFAHFSVDGKIENGKIKLELFDFLSAVISNSIVLYIVYLNYDRDLTIISTTSRVINMGSRLVLIYEIGNVFIAAVIMMLKRHDVWGIFYRCHKLDEELKTLGMRIDHKKQQLNLHIVIGVCLLIFFLMAGISGYFLWTLIDPLRAPFMIVSYMTINASMTTTLLTSAFLLYSIFIRFRLINDSIKKFFVTEEEDELKNQKSSEVLCKIVAKLADLHDTLVDIVGSFNYCFSFTLMHVVASTFLTDIFSIFAIYRVFVRYDYSQWEAAVIQYVWNLYFLIYGFIIVMLGSLVTRTGKYTAVLVHKAVNYIYDDDDPIIDVLKMFSQQMQHRAPVVTCGLFTFDFTLLFTIIGATATYIVILIQFDTDVSVPNKNVTSMFSNISLTTEIMEL